MQRAHRGQQGHGYDVGLGPPSRSSDPAPVRSEQDIAVDRVARFRMDAEQAASQAKQLTAINSRETWNLEKDKLEKRRASLLEAMVEREKDAATSAQAANDLRAAKDAIADLTHLLDRTEQPRAMPAIRGEIEIEPAIRARTANGDDVMAWAAALSRAERSALQERLTRAANGNREDAFGVALANYLGATRMLQPFKRVLENPKHFDRAAYEHARAAQQAADDVATSAAPVGAGAVPAGNAPRNELATLIPTAAGADAVVDENKRKWLSERKDALHYFELHKRTFLNVLRARLGSSDITPGHPQLQWAAGTQAFIDKLVLQLHGPEIRDWPALTHPADLWGTIDGHRAIDPLKGDPADHAATGDMHWVPSLGLAVAGEIELAVRRSLKRMGPRYVSAAGTGTSATAAELVPSAPIDVVLAEVLSQPDTVTVVHTKQSGKASAARAGHDVQRDGLRLVNEIEYLGARDPYVWNWIRIADPTDATLEEVALTLWGKPEFAYGLTPVWPCVMVPVKWAHDVPAMAALAPPNYVIARESTAQLVSSVLADEIALAQGTHAQRKQDEQRESGAAAPVPPERAHLVDALDSTQGILRALDAQLDPYGVGATPGAQKFIAEKRAWLLSASPEDMNRWAPVLLGQNTAVRDAAAGIEQVLALLQATGTTSEQIRERGAGHPAHSILENYLGVAAHSMFVETAQSKLAQCRVAHAKLPVALLATANKDADAQLGALRQDETKDTKTAAGLAGELSSEQTQVAAQIAQLQSQMLASGSPDARQLESASLATASITMRARIGSLQHALANLRNALGEPGLLDAFSVNFYLTGFEIETAMMELDQVQSILSQSSPTAVNAKYDALPPSPGREHARDFELHETRKERFAQAQQVFATVVKTRGLDKRLFEDAAQAIQDKQLRGLLLNVAELVALAVISGGIAAVAGEFAAGFYTGARGAAVVADAAGVARGARIVGGVTNFVVDASLQAAGQTAFHDGRMGSSFVENLVSNAAVMAALRPLQALARSWGPLEEGAYNAWSKTGGGVKLALAKGTVITAEMITAAGVGYATHRVMAAARGEKPDEMTVAGWASQGASILLGRYIHGQLGTSLERLKLAGRAAGDLTARFSTQLKLAAKLEHAPDSRAAMEQLVDSHHLLQEETTFWSKLADDPAALSRMGMTRDQAEAHLAGARSEDARLQGWSFVQMQLRLSGLEQEVAGGRRWAGNTEDIADALAQAKRMSLDVEVTNHDTAAREWHVKIGETELVIRERAREGRVREALPKGSVTEHDVMMAKRYAAAARELRPVMEEHTRGVVESDAEFATEVVQGGYGFGAVMHLDTRFEPGHTGDPRARLVVYLHDGSMTNRGDLRSGQNPDLQTMPGVRTREHTTDHESFTKSRDLGDAVEVGRMEMQTPAYKAEIVQLERLDANAPGDWSPRHLDKRIRLKIRNERGERWIYCNRFEHAGGMGPTDFRPAKAIIGEPGQPNGAMFEEMRTRAVLLAGDDPDISKHLHPGEKILVWGGSPTGAWAGEDAALHGAQASVVGESPNVQSAHEFQQKLARISAEGNGAEVARMIEARVRETHTGSTLARNRQAGATYGPGAKQRGIHVELGVPKQMTLLPDGKVRVEIAVGTNAGVHLYDRVVVALGQDPGAPGGPAGLLGRGVQQRDPQTGQLDMNAEVPPGTIALRMIKHSDGDKLVGLESVDKTVELVGAAYASPKLAPWVIPGERAEFSTKARTMAALDERTHTGEHISSDSAGVTTGIEAQRDRIPLANEVLSARDFRLPQAATAERLSLPKDRPEQWAERVERFLLASMHARAGRLEVVLEASGRDGVHVFRISNGKERVGLLRVYDSMSLADAEAQLVHSMRDHVPTLETGVDRGTMKLANNQAAHLTGHPPDVARAATTFDALIQTWGRAAPDAKSVAFERLQGAATTTARTLADVHALYANDGALMSSTSKEREIERVLRKLGSPKAQSALGPSLSRVQQSLKNLGDDFQAARVPLTAQLGRTELDAFTYSDYKAHGSAANTTSMFGKMAIEDVGALRATVDPTTGKGIGTAAADVAQFLESLRADPRLSAVAGDLEATFLTAYRQHQRGQTLPSDSVAAVKWYRVAYQIDQVSRGEPGAAARLVTLLSGSGT